MKTIASLNDSVLLGRQGLSKARPRRAARAIVKNKDGLYAVMYYEKFGLYSLPGGGIEDGEPVRTALRRELAEETGVICKKIREVGTVVENRACHNFTQINHYFFALVAHIGISALTKKEQAAGVTAKWCGFDELYELITSPEHKSEQRKYIQARDKAALDEYARRFLSETKE